LSSCDDGCGNEVIQTVKSPNSELEATVFVRSCGATTGFSVHASVDVPGKKPLSTGNVFIAKLNDDEYPKLKWLSDSDLQIEFSGQPIILMKMYHGISIIHLKSESSSYFRNDRNIEVNRR
jgi:hypothetical protein